MSSSNKQLTHAPAAIEDLIEAIAQLGNFDESTLKDALTSSKLKMPLRIDPGQLKEGLNDFSSDEELIDASPLPLSTQERLELIRASMSLRGNKHARPNEDTQRQDELEGLHSLLSAIRAFVDDEVQKHPADDTTQDGN